MKKQKDLEAGRRKLAEFRKKKAEEKAKKTVQGSQDHASNGNIQHNQLPEAGRVSGVDSDGAYGSDSFGEAGLRPSSSNDMMKTHVTSSNDLSAGLRPSGSNDMMKTHVSSSNDLSTGLRPSGSNDMMNTRVTSSNDSSADHSIPHNHHNSTPSGTPHVPELSNEKNSVSTRQEDRNEASRRVSYGMEPDHLIESHILPVQETISASSHLSNNDIGIDKLSYGNSHLMNNVFGSPEVSYSSVMNVSSKEGLPSSTMSNAFFDIGKSYGVHESLDPTLAENNLAGSGAMFDGIGSSSQSSDRFSGLGSVTTQNTAGSNRRSRPSFLDTINISRGPTATSFSTKPETADPFGLPVDPLQSSLIRNSDDDSVSSGKEGSLVKHLINGTNVNKHEYHSQKHNEDFAALEQHIEDLTQEKFSLQRALETSQTLAESLAAENSTLTDSYNKQGSVVAQLKGDMEMLQQEIKALLVELESVKLEYSNVLLECNAADERAKLLASEVIGLEEKALRLRSNELKLEQELESRLAEISSLKKKMLSLEKDSRDLQSTIDALQEEKKLLQSKLRKSSPSGKLVDASKSVANKKDASTSTMDLGFVLDGTPSKSRAS